MQRRTRLAGLVGCVALVAAIALAIDVVAPSPTASHVQRSTAPPMSSRAGPASGQPSAGSSAGSSPSSGPSAPPRPVDPAFLTGYVWPLPRGRLTLPFGPTPWGSLVVDGNPFHDGIDVATFCGDRIVAAHSGTVLAAGRNYDEFLGWVGDLGPYLVRLGAKHLWGTLPIVVIIDDGNGYRSVYAHFSKVLVKAGQKVSAGQRIGLEGRTGHATGCHLHYGLFSPLETATFAESPALVKQILVPSEEIARIDPMHVLPVRPDLNPDDPRVPGPGRRSAR